MRRRVTKRPPFLPADDVTLTNALIGLTYHLRRAYHEANTLAGPRPKPEIFAPAPETPPPAKLEPGECNRCTAGRAGAGYCDCKLGRDLARAERRRKKAVEQKP